MQADKAIYVDSIMSFDAILLHQNILSGEEQEYQEFRGLLAEVNLRETLLENNFAKSQIEVEDNLITIEKLDETTLKTNQVVSVYEPFN